MKITFAATVRKRKDFSYPLLEDIEAVSLGKRYELGYAFRDYGKLSLSVITRLHESDVGQADREAMSLMKDHYKLPNFVGSTARAYVRKLAGEPKRKGGDYTQWMIDEECPKVGVLDIRVVKRGHKRVFLGPRGRLFLRAASRSSNPTQSFEDLVILSVIARKMTNLGFILGAFHGRKSVDCYCHKARGREISELEGKKTELSIESPDTMRDVYLVHCERPQFVSSVLSSSRPLAISGQIYNEIYRVHHSIRTPLQIWINESSQSSKFLAKTDPYEISDRMPREITRALEKLGLLQLLHTTRFLSIPDRLLADLIRYFGEVTSEEAGGKVGSTTQLPLGDFVGLIRKEFRILVNPNDIIDFLKEYVDYRSLGIDLNVAQGYLISDYDSFVERLENLGMATVRPDGDVMVRIE